MKSPTVRRLYIRRCVDDATIHLLMAARSCNRVGTFLPPISFGEVVRYSFVPISQTISSWFHGAVVHPSMLFSTLLVEPPESTRSGPTA